MSRSILLVLVMLLVGCSDEEPEEKSHPHPGSRHKPMDIVVEIQGQDNAGTERSIESLGIAGARSMNSTTRLVYS